MIILCITPACHRTTNAAQIAAVVGATGVIVARDWIVRDRIITTLNMSAGLQEHCVYVDWWYVDLKCPV